MRCKHCGSSCTDPLPDELSTEETARLLVENHIATVAISIDGTREVHDAIRKADSFERIGARLRF
jgi:MoaA/NifB/PqqE/SkfB family radical SAM enzyme